MPSNVRATRLTPVAVHEAAHLVVAVYEGLDVRGTVSAGSSTSRDAGSVEVLALPSAPGGPRHGSPDMALAHARVRYAGYVAEQLFFPGIKSERFSRGDHLRAAELIAFAASSAEHAAATADMRAVRRSTIDLVCKFRPIITVVAEALAAVGELGANELRNDVYRLMHHSTLRAMCSRTGEDLAWLVRLRATPFEAIPGTLRARPQKSKSQRRRTGRG